MKRSNKKGFTIVELVIVIAIIAVLAAVLIPTFSGIIKKANLSADQQAVRQMNEHVAIALADKDVVELKDFINALEAEGYNAADTLIPVTKNHAFYWYPEFKTIILVDEAESAIVFPADNSKINEKFAADYATKDSNDKKMYNLEAGDRYLDVATADAATLSEALVKGNEKITLQDSVTLPNTEGSGDDYFLGKDAEGLYITLDLANKELNTGRQTGVTDTVRHQYLDITAGNTLEIKNGTINARGIEVHGKLILGEDVIINAINDGGAAIYVYAGGEVIINGATLNVASTVLNQYGASAIYNEGGKITINEGTVINAMNGGTYAINNHGAGEIAVKGATLKALYGGILGGGNSKTVVENSTIEVLEGGRFYSVYVTNSAEVTLTGCTVANSAGKARYWVASENEGFVAAKIVVDGTEYATSGGYN